MRARKIEQHQDDSNETQKRSHRLTATKRWSQTLTALSRRQSAQSAMKISSPLSKIYNQSPFVATSFTNSACSNGLNIVRMKRSVAVQFASRIARRRMPVAFIFSRLGIKQNRSGIGRRGSAKRILGC
ncbi:hypothetical protein OIU76_005755 [Salix suchowensis]|nr:hypothetical protein OIU76_005755 [Salix suchowensis]